MRSVIRPGALQLSAHAARNPGAVLPGSTPIATTRARDTATAPRNFAADRHGSPAREECEGAQLETRDLPLELW